MAIEEVGSDEEVDCAILVCDPTQLPELRNTYKLHGRGRRIRRTHIARSEVEFGTLDGYQ